MKTIICIRPIFIILAITISEYAFSLVQRSPSTFCTNGPGPWLIPSVKVIGTKNMKSFFKINRRLDPVPLKNEYLSRFKEKYPKSLAHVRFEYPASWVHLTNSTNNELFVLGKSTTLEPIHPKYKDSHSGLYLVSKIQFGALFERTWGWVGTSFLYNKGPRDPCIEDDGVWKKKKFGDDGLWKLSSYQLDDTPDSFCVGGLQFSIDSGIYIDEVVNTMNPSRELIEKRPTDFVAPKNITRKITVLYKESVHNFDLEFSFSINPKYNPKKFPWKCKQDQTPW